MPPRDTPGNGKKRPRCRSSHLHVGRHLPPTPAASPLTPLAPGKLPHPIPQPPQWFHNRLTSRVFPPDNFAGGHPHHDHPAPDRHQPPRTPRIRQFEPSRFAVPSWSALRFAFVPYVPVRSLHHRSTKLDDSGTTPYAVRTSHHTTLRNESPRSRESGQVVAARWSLLSVSRNGTLSPLRIIDDLPSSGAGEQRRRMRRRRGPTTGRPTTG
jgi:hypothetical protein